MAKSRQQLLDEIDDLRETVAELEDRLDQINDLAAPDDEPEIGDDAD